MWKTGSVLCKHPDGRHLRTFSSFIIAGLILFSLGACAGSVDAPTVIPTQELIRPTITPTPEPVTPTASPEPALSAAELLSTPAASLADDRFSANERQMLQLVIDDLAASEGISENVIQNYHIVPARWNSLDCNSEPAVTLQRGIEGYRVVVVAGTTIYDYRTDAETNVEQCQRAAFGDVRGDVLVLVDPIAAEMFALAQRRLAQGGDLPARRIQLVDMRAITWPDTSLGCPVAGQSYPEANIDGYHLTVSVGDDTFTYHTDSERLVLCAPENAVLPDADESADDSPDDQSGDGNG